MLAPDALEERIALATELRELGEQIGDRERELNGHFYRWVASVEVGEIGEAERHLEAAGRIADELRQPALLWNVFSSRAMLALAFGTLAEAEELVANVYASGERAHPGIARTTYGLQRYTLAQFRGRLGEVELLVTELAAEYPARPSSAVPLLISVHYKGRRRRRGRSSVSSRETTLSFSLSTWSGSSA
jgi:hypothetical protein